MVTPGTQKKTRKAMKKAEVAAKAKVETEVAKLKGKRNQHESVTAEDIIRERDERSLSWKQVAVNLGLGSPGAARSAYTKLTGTHHSESQMTGKRAKKGTANTGRKKKDYGWDDTDLDDDALDNMQTEVQEAIEGRVIRVHRYFQDIPVEDSVKVRRVVKFAFDGKENDGPLVVTIVDNETSAQRTFRVRDIKEVM